MSCPDCFSGHQHEGAPQGKMIKFHGLDTYVAEPSEGTQPKAIIVIIPDAFGIDFVNNKLLADTYAAKGNYRVYLPDFMLGRSCPSWLVDTLAALMASGNYLSKPYHVVWAMYGFIPWILFNRPARSFPIVKKFFEAFRREEGARLPVGVAGFCWGGGHTIFLSQQENYIDIDGASKPLFDAGFTGHPSFIQVPKHIEKIAIPISFAIPEKDHQMKVPVDTDVIARIMENKPEAQRGEVKVYEGCGHGFCVRADPTCADVAKQAAEAEDQAIAWFNTKLGLDRSS